MERRRELKNKKGQQQQQQQQQPTLRTLRSVGTESLGPGAGGHVSTSSTPKPGGWGVVATTLCAIRFSWPIRLLTYCLQVSSSSCAASSLYSPPSWLRVWFDAITSKLNWDREWDFCQDGGCWWRNLHWPLNTNSETRCRRTSKCFLVFVWSGRKKRGRKTMKNIRVCENQKSVAAFPIFPSTFFGLKRGKKTRHKKYEYNKCQMKKEEEEGKKWWGREEKGGPRQLWHRTDQKPPAAGTLGGDASRDAGSVPSWPPPVVGASGLLQGVGKFLGNVARWADFLGKLETYFFSLYVFSWKLFDLWTCWRRLNCLNGWRKWRWLALMGDFRVDSVSIEWHHLVGFVYLIIVAAGSCLESCVYLLNIQITFWCARWYVPAHWLIIDLNENYLENFMGSVTIVSEYSSQVLKF